MSKSIRVNAYQVTSSQLEDYLETLEPGELIEPEHAVTIAAFWQAPKGIGSTLASFASGARVDFDELVTDIELTISVDKPIGKDLDQLHRLMEYVQDFYA